MAGQTRNFQIGKTGRLLLSAASGKLDLSYFGPPSHALFLVLREDQQNGSSLVPYAQGLEGSTVFLPLPVNKIYSFAQQQRFRRVWDGYQWSERSKECPELRTAITDAGLHMHLNTTASERIGLVVYVKDMAENSGWGRLLGCSDPSVSPGTGGASQRANNYFLPTPVSLRIS